MQVVIVAGGQGSRLRSRLGELPKALAKVGGRPLIEHQMRLAREYGFDDIVLLLGYGRERIEECIADGPEFPTRLRLFDDCPRRGTAGAILAAMPHLDSTFLVIYGDTMLNVDLVRFWRAHVERGSAVSLFIHPNDHPHDSDVVETDANDMVIGFDSYPHQPGRDYPNQVNAALYVIERGALTGMPAPDGVMDIAKDLLPALHHRGQELFAYRSPEYIKDAGTPERLDAVNRDWESGRIERSSFAHAAPAIFLDRDGTINREVERLTSPEEFELLDGAAAAIRGWNQAGWRVVVISNQAVIARGDCTEIGLRAIHNRMETLLGHAGAYLDRIYYCPHHPDAGFAGERLEFKVQCQCRKPMTAMIRQAQQELNLDLARSWLIGDSTIDIRTARNAGVRSILVQTGKCGRDHLYPDAPDRIAADLLQALRMTN